MSWRDWLTPLHDAHYRRTHFAAHLIGGVVWYVMFLLPPFDGLSPGLRLVWVGVIQGIWERYQREYDPTYPRWSMAWDTAFALIGGGAAALVHGAL